METLQDLADWLKTAKTCLQKAEQDPAAKVDMNDWLCEYRDQNHTCLAGSVLLYEMGADPIKDDVGSFGIGEIINLYGEVAPAVLMLEEVRVMIKDGKDIHWLIANIKQHEFPELKDDLKRNVASLENDWLEQIDQGLEPISYHKDPDFWWLRFETLIGIIDGHAT